MQISFVMERTNYECTIDNDITPNKLSYDP